jgi:exodeoxyribonuclease VII small subunit
MTEEATFEQAMEELKAIVQALEKGDRPLEESLALFEKGIGLIGFCSRKLDEVEKKVEILVKNQDGTLQPRPFQESTET